MFVHRVAKKKHAGDPLAGAGGLLVGGRWHHKGSRVVYCAQSLSLASLEFFVHFAVLSKAIALVAVKIEVPDAVVDTLPAASLPPDWHSTPPVPATADLGSEWLDSGRSAALKVPSALTRGEFNILVNPAHPDVKRIRVVSRHDYSYDTRMWKA